jgi:dethiobiotin synthetase
MSLLVVTGTDTGVGKTVVTAALAALALAAGREVAVLKPAQTGVDPHAPGDLAVVRALAGELTVTELGRYPEPLAANTAARRAGLPPVRPAAIVARARELADTHDLVLIEGCGGLLVRFDDEGGTLLEVARQLAAPTVVVTRAGLGTLNATELTVTALRRDALDCLGVVIGSWPAEPDLAARCNLRDLPEVTGVPLAGALPAGAGARSPAAFAHLARTALAAPLGGVFDAAAFTRQHAPGPVQGAPLGLAARTAPAARTRA